MTEISVEALDDKSRKIIRALGNVNNALWEMDFTKAPEDLPEVVKAIKDVDHTLCAAKSVLRTYAKGIAKKYVGDKLDDVVLFVGKAGEAIAYLVINEWAQV